MKHLQSRTWTLAEVRTYRQAPALARLVRDRAEDCARLRARAEADPGNPAPWAAYCVAVQVARLQRRRRRPSRRATATKPPVGDVLALAGSQLAPDALWRGPAPDYPPDQDE